MSLRSLLITVNTLIACILATTARAETFNLAFERMTDPNSSWRSANNVFFGVSSQHFWYGTRSDNLDKFNATVKKQPDYACDQPFKGVADLGGSQFVLVLDSENLKSKGYHRLYFDFNGNGDLTDDKPVEAGPAQNDRTWSIDRAFFPLQVSLKLDGATYDYPFVITSSVRHEETMEYASASIRPAAYRQASVTLDGKPHHIAVVDYNCNGRFNDQFKLAPNIRGTNDTVYPEYGDIVVVDGKPQTGEYYWDITTGDYRQYLSKLLIVDGRYYKIEVAPAGDKLNLNPAKLKLGELTNPNDCWRAVIYGEQGLLKINGRKGQPVPVPEGEWKLLSCCVEAGQAQPTTKPQNAKAEFAVGAGREAVIPQARRESDPTRITARAKSDYRPVKISQGKLAELPFGPPYKAIVESQVRDGRRLQMSLVGVGGEVANDCQVNGNRPGEPSFVIATLDGDIVERGKFEYG